MEKTFGIKTRNLSHTANERLKRITWEIQNMIWDRLIVASSIISSIDERYNFPIEAQEKQIMAHDVEKLPDFLEILKKMTHATRHSLMPFVTMIPEKLEYKWQTFKINLDWLIGFLNQQSEYVNFIRNGVFPPSVFNVATEKLMRAYTGNCLEWSEDLWLSEDYYRRYTECVSNDAYKAYHWVVPNFNVSEQFQTNLQENVLWKWYEIWVQAYSAYALSIISAYDREEMSKLNLFQWMNLNDSINNSGRNWPLQIKRSWAWLSIGAWLGKPQSLTWIGASKAYPS